MQSCPKSVGAVRTRTVVLWLVERYRPVSRVVGQLSGSWPETGFEEIEERAVCFEHLIPVPGFLRSEERRLW
jgi:hypothetical protein